MSEKDMFEPYRTEIEEWLEKLKEIGLSFTMTQYYYEQKIPIELKVWRTTSKPRTSDTLIFCEKYATVEEALKALDTIYQKELKVFFEVAENQKQTNPSKQWVIEVDRETGKMWVNWGNGRKAWDMVGNEEELIDALEAFFEDYIIDSCTALLKKGGKWKISMEKVEE